MPAPKITFTTNSNPTSTVTIPHIALRTEKGPWASYSGLAASTTYTLATAANTPVDLEPGLYAIGVQDTAEAALFWFGGTTATILKVGGSTNVIIHVIAMAGRAGVPLDLARFDAISRTTPKPRAST